MFSSMMGSGSGSVGPDSVASMVSVKILKPATFTPEQIADWKRDFGKTVDQINHSNGLWIEPFEHRTRDNHRQVDPTDRYSARGRDDKLTAYRMVDPAKAFTNKFPKKVAIVYVCGNGELVATSVKGLIPLIKAANQLDPQTDTQIFIQDYRGRPTNEIALTDEEIKINEKRKDDGDDDRVYCNFSDFPLSQDAQDQADLIEKLVRDGYDVTVVGHSLGGNVALWAKYLLEKRDPSYQRLKVISDRTFADLTEFPPLSVFYTKKDRGGLLSELKRVGMLPPEPTWSIVPRSPAVLVLQAKEDDVIPESVSLAKKVTVEHPQTVAEGRVHQFTSTAKPRANGNKPNPHNVALKDLKAPSEYIPFTTEDFILAYALGKPLDPNFVMPKLMWTDNNSPGPIARLQEFRDAQEKKSGKYADELKYQTHLLMYYLYNNLNDLDGWQRLIACKDKDIEIEDKSSGAKLGVISAHKTRGEFRDIYSEFCKAAEQIARLQKFRDAQEKKGGKNADELKLQTDLLMYYLYNNLNDLDGWQRLIACKDKHIEIKHKSSGGKFGVISAHKTRGEFRDIYSEFCKAAEQIARLQEFKDAQGKKGGKKGGNNADELVLQTDLLMDYLYNNLNSLDGFQRLIDCKDKDIEIVDKSSGVKLGVISAHKTKGKFRDIYSEFCKAAEEIVPIMKFNEQIVKASQMRVELGYIQIKTAINKLIDVLNDYIKKHTEEIKHPSSKTSENIDDYIAAIFKFLGVEKPSLQSLKDYANNPNGEFLKHVDMLVGFSVKAILQKDVEKLRAELVNKNEHEPYYRSPLVEALRDAVLVIQDSIDAELHRPRVSVPVVDKKTEASLQSVIAHVPTIGSKIFGQFLTPIERSVLRQTDKTLMKAVDNEQIWREDVARDFPDAKPKPELSPKSHYLTLFKNKRDTIYLTSLVSSKERIYQDLKRYLSEMVREGNYDPNDNTKSKSVRNNVLGMTVGSPYGLRNLPHLSSLAHARPLQTYSLEIPMSKAEFDLLLKAGKVDAILESTTAIITYDSSASRQCPEPKKPDGRTDQKKMSRLHDQLAYRRTEVEVKDGRLVEKGRQPEPTVKKP